MCYPSPINNESQRNPSVKMMDIKKGGLPTAQEIMDEFPSVFDGHIRVMEGEQFYITLAEDAVPFCVKTPRTIPFIQEQTEGRVGFVATTRNHRTSDRGNTVVCTDCSNPKKRY